jgi:hypothetical protein
MPTIAALPPPADLCSRFDDKGAPARLVRVQCNRASGRLSPRDFAQKTFRERKNLLALICETELRTEAICPLLTFVFCNSKLTAAATQIGQINK